MNFLQHNSLIRRLNIIESRAFKEEKIRKKQNKNINLLVLRQNLTRNHKGRRTEKTNYIFSVKKQPLKEKMPAQSNVKQKNRRNNFKKKTNKRNIKVCAA